MLLRVSSSHSGGSIFDLFRPNNQNKVPLFELRFSNSFIKSLSTIRIRFRLQAARVKLIRHFTREFKMIFSDRDNL